MTTFTIQRAGEFTIHTTGPNHCGTSDILTVRYDFSAECLEGSLDHQGFLFDQTKVQTFFDSIKTTHLSCEKFCYQASRALFATIKKLNAKCEMANFTLKLSPAPFAASLTFKYVAENSVASVAVPKPVASVQRVLGAKRAA